MRAHGKGPRIFLARKNPVIGIGCSSERVYNPSGEDGYLVGAPSHRCTMSFMLIFELLQFIMKTWIFSAFGTQV